MALRERHLSGTSIIQLEKDIYKIIYSDQFKVELEHVIEMDEHFMEMTEKKPVYIITDLQGRFFSITNEAQKYIATDAYSIKLSLLKACAVVLDNLPNRLIAKFFQKFFKPDYPMKIFKNETEARKWLNELKEKERKSALVG